MMRGRPACPKPTPSQIAELAPHSDDDLRRMFGELGNTDTTLGDIYLGELKRRREVKFAARKAEIALRQGRDGKTRLPQQGREYLYSRWRPS